MPEKKFISKTITVTGIESKDGRYKITDQDNITYSFFEQWEEEDTDAFASFKELKVGINSTVDIVGAEKPGTYQGKKIIFRNIYEFKPATDAANTPTFKSKGEMSQIQGVEDKKWNDIGMAKAASLLAQSYIHAGVTFKTAKPDFKEWLQAIQQIQTNGIETKNTVELKEEVPIIELDPDGVNLQNEMSGNEAAPENDINLDIPF